MRHNCAGMELKMEKNKKFNFVLIMVIYLLGIFMGALDTGIVTPARTVIQNFLSVNEKTGIWMITMYTLAYAASIPVMGKLADKYGRKYIYLTSIFLFGIGSLFCGLSQNFGSFTILLIARAVQAVGGGGILPIATAEFGTTFPKEKRGMALGLVGGVYGIANIFGASAGSAVLDLFGTNNWQFIFYINVPITIFILAAGIFVLPNTRMEHVKRIDFPGITILTVMILSVLYGLKNIDFFQFKDTIKSVSVYPFLILFLILLPIFVLAEKKAEDPVMNLDYFKKSRILITLFLSFLTGIIIMGMIFVPQFSENALKIATGKGGYFVFILGLFAGIGAPFSGKMIDQFGVKIVLGFGFLISAVGSVFLVLVTTNYPNLLTVLVSLILVGIGIGFTMGTPINYMMLENTQQEEANSALATVSLVRSIGTAIAPAIMIGFIAHAGTAVQSNVMALLPKEATVPPLPYAQELQDNLNTLKADPSMKEKLSTVNIPDLTSFQTVKINMNSDSGTKELPKDLMERMSSSDVTTITENIKYFSQRMFEIMTPDIVNKIQDGISNGMKAMADSSNELNTGITGMQQAVKAQEDAVKQLEYISSMMTKMMPSSTGMKSQSGKSMPNNIAMPDKNFSILAMIPENIKATIPEATLKELSGIKSTEDLQKKIEELKRAKQKLEGQIASMNTAKSSMADTIQKMKELINAIPGAFSEAKNNYLKEIDKLRPSIEDTFQNTLNGGFKQVYLTVTLVSLLGLIILFAYRKKNAEA
jgi:Arabinose efflux permease